MPGPLRLRGSLVVPEAVLLWRFSRSSGPGGQGVNTTDSRVELGVDLAGGGWLPDVLRERALSRLGARVAGGQVWVAASDQRSQWQNRLAAEQRLTDLLREATAPPPRPRRPTRPTRGSVERRLTAKRSRATTKNQRRPVTGEE